MLGVDELEGGELRRQSGAGRDGGAGTCSSGSQMPSRWRCTSAPWASIWRRRASAAEQRIDHCSVPGLRSAEIRDGRDGCVDAYAQSDAEMSEARKSVVA